MSLVHFEWKSIGSGCVCVCVRERDAGVIACGCLFMLWLWKIFEVPLIISIILRLCKQFNGKEMLEDDFSLFTFEIISSLAYALKHKNADN